MLLLQLQTHKKKINILSSGLNNKTLKSYLMYRSSKFGSTDAGVAESLLAAVDGFDGVLP